MKNKKILFWGAASLLVLAIASCDKKWVPDYRWEEHASVNLESPINGATDVDPRVLMSWSVYSPSSTINEIDLYLGTDPNPPFLVKIKNQTHFRTGLLELSQTYYWRMKVTENTSTVWGGTYSFTTTSRDRTVWKYYLGLEDEGYQWPDWPFLSGDKIYQLCLNKNLVCLDAISGNLLWSYPADESAWGGHPREAKGKIYLPGKKLHCLDSMTGAVLWTFENQNNFFRTPWIFGDKLYCNSNKDVFCLDANTGAEIWAVNRSDVFQIQWIFGEKIFCNSVYKIFCLDASTGAEIWAVDRIVQGPIKVEREKILCGTRDTNFHLSAECLDAETGSTLWKQFIEETTYPPRTAVEDGKFFFATGDLLCLDADTGAQLWKFKSQPIIAGQPYVFNGKIFVSAERNFYVLLDAQSGTVLWKTEIPVYDTVVYSTPILAGNSLIVRDPSGYIFRLSFDTGNILWKYFMPPGSSLALLDDRIYVTGQDEYLSCLKID